MIKIIMKILNKSLPSSLRVKLKKIYFNIREFINYGNYDLSKDLNYNENIFKSLKFDIEKIKSQLHLLNFKYHDSRLSWHYHLFVGLKFYFGNKKINILEIGTHNGNFVNFISRLYGEGYITTIDLDESDNQFINTYDREKKVKLDKFLELRKDNLKRKNINFIKLNSLNIKKFFDKKKFDLIWIDGDHLNPQVTIDIIHSLDLLKNDGIICTDDVIIDSNFKNDQYVSSDGFQTLKHLENNGLIINYFLIKRIRKNNTNNKKYISLSIFNDNSKFPTK